MPKVRETFSRYDTVDYLKTEEDIALYMQAVMEEGGDDANFIAHALGDVASARNPEAFPNGERPLRLPRS